MQCRRPSPLQVRMLSKTPSCLTGPTKSLPMNLSCHNLKQDFSFRTYNPARAEIFALHPTLGIRFPCISGPLFNLLIDRWVSVVGGFSEFCYLFFFFFLFGLGLFLICDFIVLFSPALESKLGSTQQALHHRATPSVPLCSSVSLHGISGNKKAAFIFLGFPKWTSDSWLVTGWGWGGALRNRFTYSSLPFLPPYSNTRWNRISNSSKGYVWYTLSPSLSPISNWMWNSPTSFIKSPFHFTTTWNAKETVCSVKHQHAHCFLGR